MAVYGKNFCSSAKRAFELILRNCVRAFVLDKVTDFLLFVSKLVIVGAIGEISSYRKYVSEYLFVDSFLS